MVGKEEYSVQHAPADPSRGRGSVRRNLRSPSRLVATLTEGDDTLYKFFQRGKRVSNDGRCVGWREPKSPSESTSSGGLLSTLSSLLFKRRPGGDGGGEPEYGPYKWMKYSEVEAAATALGSYLINSHVVVPISGQPPDPNRVPGCCMVGLFSENRKEWVFGAEACNAYSLVSVPLYETLGQEAIEHILVQTEMQVIICSKELALKLFKHTRPDILTFVRLVVVMDSLSSDTEIAKDMEVKYAGQRLGITVKDMSEVIKKGKEKPVPHCPPTTKHLATICYTSGTTGVPKGVMMLHENIVADCAGAMMNGYDLRETDVHISYLPLAHMFERTIFAAGFYVGACAGFSRKNIRKHLLEDIMMLKPTVFASVPRLLNRVHDKIMAKVNHTPVMRTVFRYAYNQKLKEMKSSGVIKNVMWDTFFFSMFRKKLGGRVRLLASGSAPLSSDVLDFLRVCFSCTAVQGYGLTETSAAATLGLPEEMKTSGHVGGPISSAEVMLVDVPELGYFASNGGKDGKPEQGEVCIRGPCVSPGYFRSKEKTREVWEKDGWFHSGDIGEWLPNGSLKIIDRKKNIFKLSQGEYVAIEKIENVYSNCPHVAQCFVYGESSKHCLIAIVVPDMDTIVAELSLSGVPHQDIVTRDDVKQLVVKSMEKTAKSNGLKGFECVRDIYLTADEFDLERNLITPSFKLKRKELAQYFKRELDDMYAHL